MKKKIVIALGGNALGENNQEQIEAVELATTHIVDLIEAGHQVVIVHGNGPQVGKIQLAFSQGLKIDDNLEMMPLPESIAMSQGYIGYHLQHAVLNHLQARKIDKEVATLLTQVVVDPLDESFNKPSKPIGPFYTLEQIEKNNIEHYVEDSGRGYRQVVASPKPLNFLETNIIQNAIDSDNVVICGGGGGIPLVRTDHGYEAVDAVIDKDACAALLARKIDADMLIILTAVEQVAINFGKENEQWLDKLDLETLAQYVEEGHFAPGSMLPKVEAAAEFVENVENGVAIITSLEAAKEAIEGKKGTAISAS